MILFDFMEIKHNLLYTGKTAPYLIFTSGKNSTAFKVPFKITKSLFCLSDFDKHLEKSLILQKNHMTQCQMRAGSFFD